MNTKEALKPLYKVELVKSGRSRFYQVTMPDGEVFKLQGTTGISGMLDDGKSQGFAKAASCLAVGAVREKLLSLGADPVLLEPEKIDELLAGCETAYQRAWNAKRDRGTDYHALLEKKFKGLDFEAPEGFGDIWSGLQRALSHHAVDLELFETPCASIKHGFGTTVDAIGRQMGDWGVIDWKFARKISSDYCFQVGGGSARAFSETYGVQAKWAKIFRYDFDGKFWEVKTIRQMDEALDGLLGLLKVKTSIENCLFVEDLDAR